ncbi:MAG: Glyoxalase ElbB [Candidatus Celerinatantimonas neptuna]|nr:MAG: Glyoxalase ElbB [Candidatus Celerinatantimonas neptuna]
MKIAVILSGCGVYDGSEIQESVLTLLAISEAGHHYDCFAPDISQHDVIDHCIGKPVGEARNVLNESARIARGEILPTTALKIEGYDALWLPGGFGVAKNLSKWAISGPDGEVEPSVASLIRQFFKAEKSVAALCMAPTTVAKAMQDSGLELTLTVGQNNPDIEVGLKQCGAHPVQCDSGESIVDKEHKLVTAPCYMMPSNPATIARECRSVMAAIEALQAE